jgi:hypothetical protein
MSIGFLLLLNRVRPYTVDFAVSAESDSAISS